MRVKLKNLEVGSKIKKELKRIKEIQLVSSHFIKRKGKAKDTGKCKINFKCRKV